MDTKKAAKTNGPTSRRVRARCPTCARWFEARVATTRPEGWPRGVAVQHGVLPRHGSRGVGTPHCEGSGTRVSLPPGRSRQPPPPPTPAPTKLDAAELQAERFVATGESVVSALAALRRARHEGNTADEVEAEARVRGARDDLGEAFAELSAALYAALHAARAGGAS